MLNYLKMDFYRMRKTKTFWIYSIIIFAITFFIPIIVRVFLNMISYGLTETVTTEAAIESEIEFSPMSDLIPSSIDFSAILKAPFGGMTAIVVFPLVFAANFFYADIANGYIKNLVGRTPRISKLAISKYLVVFVEIFFAFVTGLVGTFLGNLIAYGVTFDSKIGWGLLEFLTKLLIAWAMASFVLLFAAALRTRALSIVIAVFLGTGMFSLLFTPLSFAIQQITKNYDFQLNTYIPDQLFLLTDFEYANISLLNGVISSVVLIALCLFLTIFIIDKKDIK